MEAEELLGRITSPEGGSLRVVQSRRLVPSLGFLMTGLRQACYLFCSMSASFKPFNEDPANTFIFHINLPHWRQEGVTYFVTWRLGDSLPQSKLRQHAAERDAWIKAHGLR